MRGKAEVMQIMTDLNRITPAYAGKRSFCQLAAWCRRDHPRLCGEKCPPVADMWKRSGSPPPMRGKVSTSLRWTAKCRITPAYAGKSFPQNRINIFVKDHPRLCGEKKESLSCSGSSSGSPPPMRGKAGFAYNIDAINRITPAYAGKSRKCVCYRHR